LAARRAGNAATGEGGLTSIDVDCRIADRLLALAPPLLAQHTASTEDGRNHRTAAGLLDHTAVLRSIVARHRGFGTDVDIFQANAEELRRLQRGRERTTVRDDLVAWLEREALLDGLSEASTSEVDMETTPSPTHPCFVKLRVAQLEQKPKQTSLLTSKQSFSPTQPSVPTSSTKGSLEISIGVVTSRARGPMLSGGGGFREDLLGGLEREGASC